MKNNLTETQTDNNLLIDQLSYEQAFSRLQEIVDSLENKEHSLEEALTLYEEGHSLAEYCIKLLDQAEIRVKQISIDATT